MRSNYIIVRYHTVPLACGYANAHLRITYYPKISDKIHYYSSIDCAVMVMKYLQRQFFAWIRIDDRGALSKRVEKQAAKYILMQ